MAKIPQAKPVNPNGKGSGDMAIANAAKAQALKSILARAEAAKGHKTQWDGLLDDIYKFILPYRRTEKGEAGKPRKSTLFDSTAVYSAFKFAGRLQTKLTPPFKKWFKLVPGVSVLQKDKEDIKAALAPVNEMLQIMLDAGAFHTASHEMYLDLVAGTGCLFVLDGDDDNLIRYIAAPFSEIELECGGGTDVTAVFWSKMWSPGQIVDMWPEGESKLPKAIKDRLDEGCAKQDIEVLQVVHYDRNAKKRSERWVYQAILKTGDPVELSTVRSRECPAITPRYFRLPGEVYGRGVGMFALPNAKVANKTVELILQAAALAIFGIFMTTDDDMLNPDKAQIAPGAFWHVQSNASGGFNGRSIEQVNLPQNFNISDIVLQDQRTAVKQGMGDDQLPPEVGAVRSPTEIIARQRNQNADHSGAYGRLLPEYLVKLVNRVLELTQNKGLVPKKLRIDSLQVRLQILSPMAEEQSLGEVERLVQALEIAFNLGGQEIAMLTFKVEEIFAKIAEMMGIDPTLIRTATERAGLQEIIAEILAQQQAAAAEAPPNEVAA